uniref:SUN domain-containing protein n=2 Tax=Cyclophora tenuis TaxID=216820 RepID=A0A7S1D9Q2_CYCTE|mmetsp:Transcript_3228/g.5452  ORF Transcript_3228/g.5452 Transcript_3228/m.5452 type:complete len:938 (+) Transcript_3228:90-2903(+)
MRRGRRIALLLTGVLPLLAEDDVPAVVHEAPIEEDENDVSPLRNAAEALHDDALDAIPALPVEILDYASPSLSGNVVMFDRILDDLVVESPDGLARNSSRDGLLNVTPTDKQHDISIGSEDSDTKLEGGTERMQKVDGVDDADATQQTGEVPLHQTSEAPPIDDAVPENPVVSTSVVDDTKEGGPIADEKPTPDEKPIHDEKPIPEDEDDGPSEIVTVDYASTTAGALILEKSPHMKGTSNLLNGNKDKYAISPCEEKKFVVIGLSEDILVKQVCLANYERYSSRVKDFQILGSQTMGKWVNLGTYTADPNNGQQKFDLGQPSWARYLKFRFLSHYGSEHYCTISQIMVHGSTQLQGFHEEWQDSKDEKAVPEESGAVQPDSKEQGGEKETLEAAQGEAPSDMDAEEEASDDSTTVGANSNNSKPVQSSDYDVSNANADVSDEERGNPPSSNEATGDMDEDVPTLVEDASSDDVGQSEVLSSASIDVSSHKVANEAVTATEALGTVAIVTDSDGHDFTSPKIAEKKPESDGFGPIRVLKDAQSVGDVVREIQQKLISLTPSGEKASPQGGEVEGNEVVVEEPILAEAREPFEEENSESSSSLNDEPNEPDNRPTSEVDVERSHVDSSHDDANPDSTDVGGTVASSKSDFNQDFDMPSDSLSLLKRFPSAKCLETLDFQSFKTRHLASRSTVGAHSQNEVLEPIFKRLTDEIKSLQLSQTVQDQFSKELVGCYQKILLEVVTELTDQQLMQETRFAKLEAQIELMHSTNMFLFVVRKVVLAWESIVAFGMLAKPHVTEAIQYLSQRGDHVVSVLTDKDLHAMIRDSFFRILNAKVQLSVTELLGLVGCLLLFPHVVRLLWSVCIGVSTRIFPPSRARPGSHVSQAQIQSSETPMLLNEQDNEQRDQNNEQENGRENHSGYTNGSMLNHKPRTSLIATE